MKNQQKSLCHYSKPNQPSQMMHVAYTPFEDIGDRLRDYTKITWAHAVNSRVKLRNAFASHAHMIEADVVLGFSKINRPELPIMAHPPSTMSDLTLDEFLLDVIRHNHCCPNNVKGVKLDFKSIEAFEGSLNTLKKLAPMMRSPIWLNADIIAGPINATDEPVDAQRFLDGCKIFRQFVVLSVGWTTEWSKKISDIGYEGEEVASMTEILLRNSAKMYMRSITFPVRAGLAANSINLLECLTSLFKATLTIWSSPGDYVDVKKLRKLINVIGKDKIFLDIPEDLAFALKNPQFDKCKKKTSTVKVVISLIVIVIFAILSTIIGYKYMQNK